MDKNKKKPTTDKERLRLQKKIRQDIRSIFNNAGFTLIPQHDIDIEIQGSKSDLDNIFIFENVIVIAEDTITSADKNAHLRKKAEFFKLCLDNKSEFIQFLKTIPAYKTCKAMTCSDSDIKLSFLYVSLFEVDTQHKKIYSSLSFIDSKALNYFFSISKTIKKSVKFEIFKFLGINNDEIGIQGSSTTNKQYPGLILPQTLSGFPAGYQLVSFLIDPETLLEQAYVLRKDGWMDNDCVYQRILVGSKILNMRKYLTTEGRVFVNNVIITLPDDVKVTDASHNSLNTPLTTRIVKHPVLIEIPQKSGNIGIIDGQHRVFSYHEGGSDDQYEKIISKMRGEQHLLVTGIIFPKDMLENERIRFEAKLFLEINDKQTRTNTALRQVLGMIINPFEELSIAKMVVNRLAERAPMDDVLEQHFFDKRKLKTSSIVSYGMKHLIKLSGDDSFFSVWSNKKKNSLRKGKDKVLLKQYIDFCTNETNGFLQAFKKNTPSDMWTTNQKISRVLTATTIIGLIYCLRLLIKNKKQLDFNYYDKCFKKLNKKIDFTPKKFKFKSSHWKDLGDEIYNICFI